MPDLGRASPETRRLVLPRGCGIHVAGRTTYGNAACVLRGRRHDRGPRREWPQWRPIPGSHIRVDAWDTVQAGKDGAFRFSVHPGIVRLEVQANIDGEWQVQQETLYPK